MPTPEAPEMSSHGRSPTKTAVDGSSTSRASRAARKAVGWGFWNGISLVYSRTSISPASPSRSRKRSRKARGQWVLDSSPMRRPRSRNAARVGAASGSWRTWGVHESRWRTAASSSRASATSRWSSSAAAASRSARVALRWWVAVVVQKAASTATSRSVSSSSRSGARWRAASRQASTSSADTNSASVPPQSKTTAWRVTGRGHRSGGRRRPAPPDHRARPLVRRHTWVRAGPCLP